MQSLLVTFWWDLNRSKHAGYKCCNYLLFHYESSNYYLDSYITSLYYKNCEKCSSQLLKAKVDIFKLLICPSNGPKPKESQFTVPED